MRTLALDVGTSVVKAVLFDAAGEAVRVARREVGVDRDEYGRSEQDMDEVWGAVVACIRDTSQEAGVDAIAVTAQGDGCWLIDDDHHPVAPAILWSDGRSHDRVESWSAQGREREGRDRNGLLLFPGSLAAILGWLADERPELLEKASWATTCGGFVAGKLTGVQRNELSDASHPFADYRTGAYDSDQIALFDAEPWRRLLPPLVASADSALPLDRSVAATLGLPAGTPVVQAPYDVPSSAIGSGCVGPDSSFAILGTALICGTLRRPAEATTDAGAVIALGHENLLLEFHPTLTGTSVLGWAADLMQLSGVVELVELASQVPPKAGSSLALPYFSPAGERAPVRDPDARAALIDLSFATTRADLARTLTESMMLVVRECVAPDGAPPTELNLCGGAANSEFWCQLVADGVPVRVQRPAVEETGARGAMISARIALGDLPDLASSAERLALSRTTFRPDPELRHVYDDLYSRFLKARGDLSI